MKEIFLLCSNEGIPVVVFSTKPKAMAFAKELAFNSNIEFYMRTMPLDDQTLNQKVIE